MKGVEPRVMMAQMFGKETGQSRGRDSALHSGVRELGIFGNSGSRTFSSQLLELVKKSV